MLLNALIVFSGRTLLEISFYSSQIVAKESNFLMVYCLVILLCWSELRNSVEHRSDATVSRQLHGNSYFRPILWLLNHVFSDSPYCLLAAPKHELSFEY